MSTRTFLLSICICSVLSACVKYEDSGPIGDGEQRLAGPCTDQLTDNVVVVESSFGTLLSADTIEDIIIEDDRITITAPDFSLLFVFDGALPTIDTQYIPQEVLFMAEPPYVAYQEVGGQGTIYGRVGLVYFDRRANGGFILEMCELGFSPSGSPVSRRLTGRLVSD